MNTFPLRGKEYSLSPRLAFDVLELTGVMAKYTDNTDPITNIISMSQVIADSLKATGYNLGFIKGLRYWRWKYFSGLTYILKATSPIDLGKACEKVFQIEEAGKKELGDQGSQ